MNGLWRLLFTIVIVFFFFFATPCSSADLDGLYEQCATPFSCLKFMNLGFPFWGSARPANCGIPAFQLTCRYYSDYVTIDLSNLTHKILELDLVNKTMRVQRQDLMDGCFTTPRSSIIDFTLFSYSPGYQNVTFFYGCSSPPRRSTMFHLPAANDCYINGSSYYVVYVGVGSRGSESCNLNIVLPIASVDVEKIGSLESLMSIATEGFEIKWKVDSAACNLCLRSNGQCGYNASMSDSTVCYCIQPPYLGRTCPSLTANAPPASSPSGTRSRKLLMTAGITVAVICGSVFLALAYFIIRRRNPIWQTKESMNVSSSDASSSRRQVHLFNKNPSYPFTKFEIEKGSTYFGVQVFNYAELEDATDYFDPSHQLGDGGFGVVYYGELHDGRPVAVKRLYERNFKSMEQFMNEVEILARLRHPNLVTLYGCTSRRSRDLLLVYEYVPNGTLAEHLHGRQSSSGFLNWPVRLNIALETASALAYLHASDIIHRDVKTTNILLDGKLSVKVVDFGLSRLFPVDVTHISTAPQGTAGYVDPEYYTCYQLTDKSDVYSFGVVMAELISSKEAVDVTRRRHEINLANMALTMMQERSLDDLVDPRLGFESDDAVRNEVIRASDLAFRCLQKDPAARPSMDEVLDVLREIANAVSGDIAGRDDRNDDSPFLRPTVKGDVYPRSPDSVVNTQWTSGSVTSN